MIIEKDRVVTLVYQLFSLGEHQEPILVEERTVDDPVEFLFGYDVLLPKLEAAIEGQSRGYQNSLELHPQDAFGLHKPELQTWLDKNKFPKEPELQMGMKFQTQGPRGDVISVIVKDIQENKVLIDGNHPLAGIKIKFEFKVVRVREAKDEEILNKEVNSTHLH